MIELMLCNDNENNNNDIYEGNVESLYRESTNVTGSAFGTDIRFPLGTAGNGVYQG